MMGVWSGCCWMRGIRCGERFLAMLTFGWGTYRISFALHSGLICGCSLSFITQTSFSLHVIDGQMIHQYT